MILPGNYPITAFRNGVYRDQIAMADGAGAPIDMTGWTGRMQVRVSAGAADPALIDINTSTPTSNGSVITLVTPAAGVFEIYIAVDDWATVPKGSPVSIDAMMTYDIVWTEPGGDANVWQNGSLTLKEGVTR